MFSGKKSTKCEVAIVAVLLLLVCVNSIHVSVHASSAEPPKVGFDGDTYMYSTLSDATPTGDSYKGYEHYGGHWSDAEKTADNTDDDLMCWAATASNILEWTGWGLVSGMSTSDQMFQHFQAHWKDTGGWMEWGWRWWFDGVDLSGGDVDVPGGGNFWSSFTFSNFYHEESDDSKTMEAIDSFLHSGYGVGLAIFTTASGAHAITCWGYNYNPTNPKDYIGVWVTDSDDEKHHNAADPPPDMLRYYKVAYDSGNSRWHLQDYYGSNDWYIGEVQALEHLKFTYVYCTWGMDTMQDEINYLHSLNAEKYSFDWYNENNIANLWTNLAKYRGLLIDEDTFYSDWWWSQYGGPIYTSFKNHASDLETFVKNGGGIFTSGENDLYKTQAWDWLPPSMRVTSYDPESTSNVHMVFDPGAPKGLYSYPNSITDSYLSLGHTHAWFTSWDAGYVVTVRRTDNNEPIELYGVFGKGCIVVSHVEAESGYAWQYLQNQLDFIVPPTKYTMTVLSPTEGTVFRVGDTVLFEVTIADTLGNPGTGAAVTVNSPAGALIFLTETPPGSGIYTGTYTISPTDPVGTWAISFVASIEGEFPKQTVPIIIPVDSTPPTITVVTPRETPPEALQDGVTLKATVSDPSGVDWVTFSIRGPDGTVIDPDFESMSTTHISGDIWQLPFNTYVPKLPDGYYLLVVNASDIYNNEGSKTVVFSICNWGAIELLPASETNKAGRTMPVKFSIRVKASVDSAQPFIYNEELTIKIYKKASPSNILLQTSTFGTTSRDYRIDLTGELYITNFKTLSTPATYVVEIYRKGMLIGSFEFKTVK